MNDQHLEFACPHCGKPGTLDYSYVLHREKDPERYKKLLDGTLFEQTCPFCGEKMHLTYGILLHDPAARGMCFYCPDVEELPGLADSVRAAGNTETGLSMNGYAIRITSEERKLIEKAAVWNRGYDDKTVEMWKLTYLYHVVAHREDFEADDSEVRFTENGAMIDFYREGKYIGSVDADLSLLPGVRERFLSRDTGVEEEDLFVDLGWAMAHLTNLLHRPETPETKEE